ncbi:MAG: hypothetical protein HYU66_27915 [Armatimonadetes bacterium]|nr:hypothetical protein [Armatimonadota bacterium]
MRITLEDLRLYLADRRGDLASALGVSGLALVLLALARMTGNPVLGIISFANFAFLWVPLGGLFQKRRVRLRWEEQGIDAELFEQLEALSKVDWSLDEHVDAVLSVYTTMQELARHNEWFDYPESMEEHLGSVREGLQAFFQRVHRVDELRRLYDRCAESLRRPERLAALQSRVDREYRLLESFADAFERALLDFSEAMAAAMGTGDERAMTRQLNEFAASMRRLAQSIDEAESVENLFGEEGELEQFDRLLDAEAAPAEAATESESA